MSGRSNGLQMLCVYLGSTSCSCSVSRFTRDGMAQSERESRRSARESGARRGAMHRAPECRCAEHNSHIHSDRSDDETSSP